MEKLKKLLFYNLDKAILNNITRVVVYLILILSTIQIVYKILEISTFITIIGAIFAFWYGYKKYERDKELEIIEKYTKIYDDIKKEHDYDKLINLWYKEYYLYTNGYINEKLWYDWSFWIEENIKEYIYTDISKGYKKLGIKGDDIEYKKTIHHIINDNNYFIHKLRFVSYNNHFKEYIIERIEKLYNDRNKILNTSNILNALNKFNKTKTINKKEKEVFKQATLNTTIFKKILIVFKKDLQLTKNFN